MHGDTVMHPLMHDTGATASIGFVGFCQELPDVERELSITLCTGWVGNLEYMQLRLPDLELEVHDNLEFWKLCLGFFGKWRNVAILALCGLMTLGTLYPLI